MKALAGTWRLFLLSLRLDRIKLPVWILANVGLVALTIPQLKLAYGSAEQQLLYASATAPSAVTRLFGGALTGPSFGEIMIIETYALILVLSALMSIFLVVRHTRQNEETNRSEMIGAMVVGRQAQLTATLLLAFFANLVTAGMICLVLLANDLPQAGSIIYSLGIGLVGMFFAGVAAVTSQLYENTRAASGTAGLLFGIAFVIRGVGDAFGQLLPSGLGVRTNAVSWLSPAAWVTNSRPFAGEIWWAPGLFAILIPLLIVGAYLLLNRRDVGAGIFASRLGRLHAKLSLLRPFGLTIRLNRVAFIAWLVSFVAMGLLTGAVAEEFKELIAGNEEMQQILAAMGGGNDPVNIMFSAIFTIGGIAAAAYGLQILTRMRSEESSGRLELMFSTRKSRPAWLGINLIFAMITSGLLLVAMGIASGISYGIISGDVIHQTWLLGSTILVHLPAVCVLLGVSLVFFGLLPRFFVAFTWALLAGSLLIFQLGAILEFPQWVMNISPFSHTPPTPAASVTLKPLLIQSIVALGLFVIGFILFRRRDLITE